MGVAHQYHQRAKSFEIPKSSDVTSLEAVERTHFVVAWTSVEDSRISLLQKASLVYLSPNNLTALEMLPLDLLHILKTRCPDVA